EPGTGNPLRQIAPRVDVGDWIPCAVENQGGDAESGQNLTDVDLAVHLLVCDHRGWTSGGAHDPSHRIELLFGEVLLSGARAPDVPLRRPVATAILQEFVMLLGGQSPRIVGRPHPAGLAAPDHERDGSFGEGGSEEARHRGAFRAAENDRALASGAVHDGTNVVGPLLERRHVRWAIRKPRTALVEPNQPTE